MMNFFFCKGKLHKHEASHHDVLNDENETKIIKTWEQIAKFSEYVDPGKHGKSESVRRLFRMKGFVEKLKQFIS